MAARQRLDQVLPQPRRAPELQQECTTFWEPAPGRRPPAAPRDARPAAWWLAARSAASRGASLSALRAAGTFSGGVKKKVIGVQRSFFCFLDRRLSIWKVFTICVPTSQTKKEIRLRVLADESRAGDVLRMRS